MATMLADRQSPTMSLVETTGDTTERAVDISRRLRRISKVLFHTQHLEEAEEALDETKDILGLRWACWTPDTSQPSSCKEAIHYCVSRGWPESAMEIWQDRGIPLKTSIYIRCRFEHLPFATNMDARGKQRVSSKWSRLDDSLRSMGISTMLTVPVHLPKGQVGMITWGGSPDSDLVPMLGEISGELLAIGNYFMRVYGNRQGYSLSAAEELSKMTPREWDCLRTLAQGYREAEIADILGILKSTVRYHLHNVILKFGCKNRTQAIALAAQLGLLGPIGP